MASETARTYDRIAARFAEMHRETRVTAQMERFTATIPAGAAALDAGCGPGRDLVWLDELGCEAVGLDISMGMLREARDRSGTRRVVRGDCHLEVPASAFGGVWMCASLLDVPKRDAPAVLAEARRVLRKGGPLRRRAARHREVWRCDPDLGRQGNHWHFSESLDAIAVGEGAPGGRP